MKNTTGRKAAIFAVKVLSDSLLELVDFANRPSIWRGAAVALKVINNYHENLSILDFKSGLIKFPCIDDKDISECILKILEKEGEFKVIVENTEVKVKEYTWMDDENECSITFHYDWRGFLKIYLTHATKQQLFKRVAELLLPLGRSLQVHVAKNDDSWKAAEIIIEKDNYGDCRDDVRTDEMVENLRPFIKNGGGRSILLYGPPGTGKSNLIRSTSKALEMKSLRFTSMSNVSTAILEFLIEATKSEVVVLEDLDGDGDEASCINLNQLEVLNKMNLIVLATANQINTLNKAILRPGRFDQLIECCAWDEQHTKQLLGEDEEFQIFKSFPIAIIHEMNRRISAWGKDKAIASMNDLLHRGNSYKGKEYRLHDEKGSDEEESDD
jgi:hypothetical protein